ncbi:uncharacterized protein LTHEOB_4268 [Lasiodiplodia theobromae]|uniref:uncharacterized protein n=1 Tax=Lasiodiplodia theobromae TaxID=45133 RepID=UPI0015C3A712|nr:uncharacterized protein LTHEOB_4268 [Lasiodiplodia theobromae]KAF4546271.1 hypothetical protein LTHEOB_4268 [Lasiodiplodia theobromae]
MSNMAETHTEDQWDALKDELRSLYLERDMALPAVSRLMEERHGFSARKNQYEKHFKRWKWSKNLSSEQWRQIDNMRRDRQVQGRDSVFYDRGRRIPQQQLDRSTRSAAIWASLWYHRSHTAAGA